MRNRLYWPTLLLLLAGIFLMGCDDEVDHTPPGVPRGVASITGDEQVEIVWLGSTEPDLHAYIVYREDDDPDDLYEEIGQVDVDDFQSEYTFVDDFVQNGDTYFYAVSAVDYDGNESDLSYENVHDTPRPAGYNVYVDLSGDLTGFVFSRRMKVENVSPDADIVFTYDEDLQTLFIESANGGTYVQDFGYTESLDDLDWAPQDGWSSVGWCEAILGHSYVISTNDNRYAKVRITDIGNRWLMFDWAHQLDYDNPELKPTVPDSLKTQNP